MTVWTMRSLELVADWIRSGLRGLANHALTLTLACLICTTAQAQTGVPTTTLTTSLDTLLSYTVDSRRGGLKGADFVSELRPGVQITSRSGRVIGSLSYALGLVHHTQEFDGNDVQNQLNATVSAEAIERWLYVDGSAVISQQAASAFGLQSDVSSTQSNPNRVEVGTATLSPYFRGVFGSAVSYEARLSGSVTNGRRSIAADSSQTGGSLSLSSVVGGSAVGWGLVASTSTSDFRAGRATQSDRYTASLSYLVDADWNLSARAGQESTDVAKVQKTTYDNWGAGLTWRPSPRTRAQLEVDDRYFGRSHRALFEHRLPSSSIQFLSSRDITGGSAADGAGQRSTLYQIFFAQFASLEPDPALRDLLVRNFLQARGLDPSASVAGGFLSTAVTLVDRHQLTLSYAGPRVTGSLQVFSSSSRAVDAVAVASATEDVRQAGYLATASYRLTPTASLTATGSRLLTQATSVLGGTTLKSASLGFLDQLARRTSLTLGVRYSVFNGGLTPYREAAATASLNQRF